MIDPFFPIRTQVVYDYKSVAEQNSPYTQKQFKSAELYLKGIPNRI